MERKDTPPLPSSLPRGVNIATAASGHVYQNRDDLLLLSFDSLATYSAAWTQHKLPAAPVSISQKHYKHNEGSLKGVLVNAGNANAFTGEAGILAALSTADLCAQRLGCAREHIMLASTGVTGEPFTADAICSSINTMDLGKSKDLIHAARAITTTDAYPKITSDTLQSADVRVVGFAKGAGMICPQLATLVDKSDSYPEFKTEQKGMATMLAFLIIDAKIAAPDLKSIVHTAVDQSFNAITVDGDMSTNDTVMIIATGTGPRIDNNSPLMSELRNSIARVCGELSDMIVADGEGATKIMRVHVSGSLSTEEAHRVALKVAGAPLVKTALFSTVANWGRIAVAAGGSGCAINPELFALTIEGVSVMKAGSLIPLDAQTTNLLNQRWHENKVINISLDLGVGHSQAKVSGCDLNNRYVEINASYKS